MKSIEQKILEGNYREDRHGSLEAVEQLKAPITSIDIPKTIKDKRTKSAWENTIPNLCSFGLISIQDIPILETAFIALDCVYKAQDEITKAWKEEELDIKKINNLSLIVCRSSEVFSSIVQKFGVSPLSRAKLLSNVAIVKKEMSLADKMTE